MFSNFLGVVPWDKSCSWLIESVSGCFWMSSSVAAGVKHIVRSVIMDPPRFATATGYAHL